MRSLKYFSVCFFISAMIGFGANAADGSSGCGPGWYILPDNSILSSALRATTNGLLFPVFTIGMTFGTSNCTKHKLVEKEKESLYFATQNYFELQGDMARGQGEYLAAFATTMGCKSEAAKVLGHQLQRGYSQVFPQSGVQPEKLLLEVYKQILQNSELTRQCSLDVG